MPTILRLAASAALLAALAGPSLAADYDPPIFIEQAPEYVPVEIGSGWYLRGDVTYMVDDPLYEFTFLGEETRNNRFGGSVGIGYHFNDILRGDVSIGLLASDRFSATSGMERRDAKYDAWYGMANAYLDLGTVAGFTPYIGAGAGLLHTRQNYSRTIAGTSFPPSYDENQTNFAYALNAGINYQVADNVSLDFGYQYVDSPRAEYRNSDTFAVERGIDFHQVKVGLRYDLW
ncbi:porin family protein [Mesorhizobium sp. YIM 152430]|uniref:outer membrane protein n=1 Tax=Mesorhizobium sp. YIM 152430 TaxID=3031761 RepID=UPI0023D9E0AF|nr:outer membrane protein [Mesorhizobium sp. YIM 152430]MDF1599277.1 porin family protein [Mesorhizobium sp. YIM 152430]